MLSLMNNNIKELTQVPICSELKSLLLFDNEYLYDIHEDFFQSMVGLVVLDLSETGLEKLPRSIKKLVSLRYLNISFTGIREISTELVKLARLKHLDLSNLELKAKRSVISSFSSLEVLVMDHCVNTYDDSDNDDEEEEDEEVDTLIRKASVDGKMLLEELQCLKHLKKLNITLRCISALERLFVTGKLLAIIHSVCLMKFNGSEPLNISLLASMKHLVELYISRCDLEDILVDFTFVEGTRDYPHNYSTILGERSFNSLKLVQVFKCPELKDLTWLILVPNLTTLWIEYCDKMEEIIDGVKLGDMRHQNFKPFSKLSFLRLDGLPRLMCIYPNALPFPLLCNLKVQDCPLLKELPFDSNSREGCKIVLKAKKDWWEAVDWEDDATKDALSSRFKCTLY